MSSKLFICVLLFTIAVFSATTAVEGRRRFQRRRRPFFRRRPRFPRRRPRFPRPQRPRSPKTLTPPDQSCPSLCHPSKDFAAVECRFRTPFCAVQSCTRQVQVTGFPSGQVRTQTVKGWTCTRSSVSVTKPPPVSPTTGKPPRSPKPSKLPRSPKPSKIPRSPKPSKIPRSPKPSKEPKPSKAPQASKEPKPSKTPKPVDVPSVPQRTPPTDPGATNGRALTLSSVLTCPFGKAAYNVALRNRNDDFFVFLFVTEQDQADLTQKCVSEVDQSEITRYLQHASNNCVPANSRCSVKASGKCSCSKRPEACALPMFEKAIEKCIEEKEQELGLR